MENKPFCWTSFSNWETMTTFWWVRGMSWRTMIIRWLKRSLNCILRFIMAMLKVDLKAKGWEEEMLIHMPISIWIPTKSVSEAVWTTINQQRYWEMRHWRRARLSHWRSIRARRRWIHITRIWIPEEKSKHQHWNNCKRWNRIKTDWEVTISMKK